MQKKIKNKRGEIKMTYYIEKIKDEKKLKVYKIRHDAGVHGIDIIPKSFGRKIVIISEPAENFRGLFVDNSFIFIATAIYKELLLNINPKKITWVVYCAANARDGRLAPYTQFGREYRKVEINYTTETGRLKFLNVKKFKPFRHKKIKSYFHNEIEIPAAYLFPKIKKLSWWTRRKL